MATVTGNLSTFGLSSAALIAPEILFIPSGPAVVGSLFLLASNPVVVSPEYGTGFFSVALAPTDTLRPAGWYTIRIRSLDSAAGYMYADFPDWKLFVPEDGGAIGDLLQTPWNPTLAWRGPDDPTGTPVANTLWLDTDSPMLTLSIWSN